MWKETPLASSHDYERRTFLFEKYPSTRVNGIPRFGKIERIFSKWGELRTERVPEKKTFGISLRGIKEVKGELTIDPKQLKPNVFYLFSYKDEKYVTRKTDEGIVEVFEVIE